MSEVEKKVTIAAPLDRVWAALTERDIIAEWMMDDTVEIDLQVGGAYAFFGHDTTGKLTRITPQSLLEYTWRQAEWPSDWADSLVRWELQGDSNSTHVHLVHSQFPNDDERDSHDEGWEIYWLETMVEWLEGP